MERQAAPVRPPSTGICQRRMAEPPGLKPRGPQHDPKDSKKNARPPEQKWLKLWGRKKTLQGRSGLARPHREFPEGQGTAFSQPVQAKEEVRLYPHLSATHSFLLCARAACPRPAFGVCRLTSATPHLV